MDPAGFFHNRQLCHIDNKLEREPEGPAVFLRMELTDKPVADKQAEGYAIPCGEEHNTLTHAERSGPEDPAGTDQNWPGDPVHNTGPDEHISPELAGETRYPANNAAGNTSMMFPPQGSNNPADNVFRLNKIGIC
jgi:hypothetical protein